jgi:hypothetical protein
VLVGVTLHAGAADRRALLREQVSRPGQRQYDE